MILGSLILDQRNRKVFIYMLLILFCLFTTSCIKQMNLYQGDKEEDENGGNASTNQEVRGRNLNSVPKQLSLYYG